MISFFSYLFLLDLKIFDWIENDLREIVRIKKKLKSCKEFVIEILQITIVQKSLVIHFIVKIFFFAH